MITQKYEGIRIIPTYYCNRNCNFCYQKTKSCNFADINKIKKVLENIDFIPAYITFMGGELSCFPKETKELISMTHSLLPMVFTKSLTTNSGGDFKWYESLKNDGISRINFSCHNNNDFDNLKEKIVKLFQSAFFTVKVNSFLDKNNVEKSKQILNLCSINDIPLTFCCDLREHTDDISNIIKSLCYATKIEFYDNYSIVTIGEYSFWIYYHNDYKANNLIILPDGSITDNFKDVEDCKGIC